MATDARSTASVTRTLPTTCSSSGTIKNVNPPLGGYSCGCSRRKPRGDQIHFGLRRGHGHAGFQRADHVVVLAVAPFYRGRRERQRQEDVAVLGDAERRQHLAGQREARRQDADDPARLAIQRDRRADDMWIQSVAPRPRAVAEDSGARRTGQSSSGVKRRPTTGCAPSIGSRLDETRMTPIRSGSPRPVSA